jgi:hypothetical protein
MFTYLQPLLHPLLRILAFPLPLLLLPLPHYLAFSTRPLIPCTKLELPWAFLDPSVLLYCGTSPDTVFTAPATSPNETPAPSLSSGPTSLLVLTNSSTGQKLRAPAHYVCCVTDHPPKRSALACCSRVRPRAFAATADDKFVESEVAPRVTPVAAARRSRPYPRAHPLLRIGDPSPYAPSPALPSVDPTVLRSYPLSFYKPKHDPSSHHHTHRGQAEAQNGHRPQQEFDYVPHPCTPPHSSSSLDPSNY